MTLILFSCAVLVAFSREVQAISSWRPIVPSHTGAGILQQEVSIFENAPTQTLYDIDSPHHLLLPHDQDTCSLYKVSMKQQLYFEVRSPNKKNLNSNSMNFLLEYNMYFRRVRLTDTIEQEKS